MTILTDTQVHDTMDHFQMDYTYGTRLDGTCLTVDVADPNEGEEFARHLGIDDQPMTTERYGDMVSCSWESVSVLN